MAGLLSPGPARCFFCKEVGGEAESLRVKDMGSNLSTAIAGGELQAHNPRGLSAL